MTQDEANIVSLPARRMSEADFDHEWQRLREVYGDTSREAAARRDQELAKFFWRTGWTQDDIALKVGKSRKWVDFRIRFGRFLTFSEKGTSGTILTERRFRQYWEQTNHNDREIDRFRVVQTLIEAEAGQPKDAGSILAAIREHFSDGKWHTSEAIARRVDVEAQKVEQVLNIASGRKNQTYKIERRRQSRSWQYRIFIKTNQTVSTTELTEKLGPLIAELKVQGSRNMATIAITRIAKIAAELQEFLTEWTR